MRILEILNRTRPFLILCLFLTVTQLCTAASVKRFGAKGDGTTDDTNAIQRAIRATHQGTLLFPAGTYKVTKPLLLQGNVTYQGQGQPVLTGTNGDALFVFQDGNANNITITGIVFDNGQIRTEGRQIPPKNVHITGNVFRNLAIVTDNWTLQNAIFGWGGLIESSIDHNTFSNLLANGSTRPDGTSDSIGKSIIIGIMMYGLDRTRISDNTFDRVGQGIKICFSQLYPSSDVYIGNNVMTNIHRMGMEIQGASGCGGQDKLFPNTKDLIIENNNIASFLDHYWESFGISFANPIGVHVIIRNNNIVGGRPIDPAKPGYGIEASSEGVQVYGNTIQWYGGQAITIFENSTNAQIHDNRVCGHGIAPDIGPQTGPSRGAVYRDNIKKANCPL
jgi:pectate lyase-like protein